MNLDALMGVGSAAAAGLAALSMGGGLLGPETCVPVGAIVLLAIASPRDIWQIARRQGGLDKGGGS